MAFFAQCVVIPELHIQILNQEQIPGLSNDFLLHSQIPGPKIKFPDIFLILKKKKKNQFCPDFVLTVGTLQLASRTKLSPYFILGHPQLVFFCVF